MTSTPTLAPGSPWAPPPPPAKKSRRKLWIILGVVGGLIVISAAASAGKQDKANQTESLAPATAAAPIVVPAPADSTTAVPTLETPTTVPPTTQAPATAPPTTTAQVDPDIVFAMVFAPAHVGVFGDFVELTTGISEDMDTFDLSAAAIKSFEAAALMENLRTDAEAISGVEGPFGQALVGMTHTCEDAFSTFGLAFIASDIEALGNPDNVAKLNSCTAQMDEVTRLMRETTAKL